MQIEETTKKIAELFPVAQLQPETALHIYKELTAILFKFRSAIQKDMADQLTSQVAELTRRLYIAEKAVEDSKL